MPAQDYTGNLFRTPDDGCEVLTVDVTTPGTVTGDLAVNVFAYQGDLAVRRAVPLPTVRLTSGAAGTPYGSSYWEVVKVYDTRGLVGADVVVSNLSGGTTYTVSTDLTCYSVDTSPASQIVSGTVALSDEDRERADLTWWGMWALVGLTLTLIAAPRWFAAFRVTHGG